MNQAATLADPHPFGRYGVPIALAGATLLLHLLVNATGGYGYFRDELYYIACSEHLDWGYVDHPPLSILLLRVSRALLGDSVFALRLLPALAGAGLVLLTGRLVRQLGGGRAAQALACLGVMVAPISSILTDFYSMNAFEPLLWMGAASVLLRLVETRNPRLWPWVGAIVGLGLQNKHSMAFFAAAVALGLLATRPRALLFNRWCAAGAALAFLLFLPNLVWQAAHGWPTLEFAANAQAWKNMPMSPGEFLRAQVLLQHPVAAPLWLGGLAALAGHRRLRAHRGLALAFLVLAGLFVVQRGKPYYLSPFFPLLLAAGATAFEEGAARRGWRLAAPAYAGVLLAAGAITLPLCLPVLPVDTYLRYAAALGLAEIKMERHADTVLPQVWADRFGWPELAAEVARVHRLLPVEDRPHTLVYGQNYGEAAAIDFFGPAHGLPPAISGHNSYWHWGTRGRTPRVVIVIGGRIEDHRRTCASVEAAGFHTHPYAMRYESDLTIFVCRDFRVPFDEVWRAVRHYD